MASDRPSDPARSGVLELGPERTVEYLERTIRDTLDALLVLAGLGVLALTALDTPTIALELGFLLGGGNHISEAHGQYHPRNTTTLDRSTHDHDEPTPNSTDTPPSNAASAHPSTGSLGQRDARPPQPHIVHSPIDRHRYRHGSPPFGALGQPTTWRTSRPIRPRYLSRDEPIFHSPAFSQP